MNDNKLFFKYAHPEYYYKYFPIKIRQRGREYYFDNKIMNFEEISDCNYKAIVKGTDNYKVSLKINPHDIEQIENMSCTCRFYLDNKVGCKHIYAVLLKYLVEKEKTDEIYADILRKMENMNSKLDRAIDLTERNNNKLPSIKPKKTRGILSAFIDSFKGVFLTSNEKEDNSHLYDYEKDAMKNYGYGKDDFEEEELEDDDYYFDDDREK